MSTFARSGRMVAVSCASRCSNTTRGFANVPADATNAAVSAIRPPVSGGNNGATSSYIHCVDPDRKRMVDEMLRVDHAGEVAAVQIYAGQLWALRGSVDEPLLQVGRCSQLAH